MTISGAYAGAYKPTDKMWASYDGQWVPIPTALPPLKWTRPTFWPTTTVTAGEQKIQMIVEVWNYSDNHFTINAAGAYTVDWGDGTTVQNFATGVLATHNYSWSAIGLTTTTPEGYRCAVVTITPQAANQLTSLNLITAYSGAISYGPPVLELVVGPSTLTTLTIGHTSSGTGSCSHLRSINFLSPVTLNGNELFKNCRALRKVAGTITLTTTANAAFMNCWSLTEVPSAITLDATVTSCNSMFYGCQPLAVFPTMDTSRVTNFNSMFAYCTAFTEAPSLNTSAGTDFAFMFQECYGLKLVPLYDTANGINFAGMFDYCRNLVTAPAFNTAKGTNFSYMFESCYNVKNVPTYNTSLGTDFSFMFYSCYCLETLPPLDTANGTNFRYYAASCYLLVTVPAMNTAKGTEFRYMFSYCVTLNQAPTLNTALATGTTCFQYMFNNCSNLVYIPNTINAAGGTVTGAFTGMFQACESLRSNPFSSGPKYTFTVADTMLDVTELNALFTALPSVSAQTITITNCPGAAGCTRSIATGKGWTVTG